MVNRLGKILPAIFVVCIVLSVSVVAVRVLKWQDYEVLGEVVCDPRVEACFIRSCDDELAICDTGEENQYYKIVEKNADSIQNCSFDSTENCQPLQCQSDDMECVETLCADGNVPEGESCSNPEAYRLHNEENVGPLQNYEISQPSAEDGIYAEE